jgi:DNA replication regulator DPB11
MKIVSLEWLQQSLERGMVLDEALYNPTLPIEERGREAWVRLENPSPALGKRARDVEQPQPLNSNRRKLRRAASTKLGFQGDALWAEITTQSFDQGNHDEDEWKEDNLFKQTTPQDDFPAALHQDDTIDQIDNANANAHLPVPAISPLVTELEQGEGVFQGRIVVTHGFDQEKVRCATSLSPANY